VLICRTRMNQRQVGDVVAFCIDKQILIGRIDRIEYNEDNEPYFRVKADNLDAVYRHDVTRDVYLGEVVLHFGKLAGLFNFFNTWAGIILLEGIPWLVCVGIVVYELRQFRMARKKTYTERNDEADPSADKFDEHA